jgi:hypothetical protein
MQSLAMETPNGLKGSNLSSKSPLRLTLAESVKTVSQSVVEEFSKDNCQISVCNNLEELELTFKDQAPDIILIGALQEASCLEIYRRCADQWPKLPVILLSHQPTVNEFFKEWVTAKGVRDVFSSFPNKLSLLREAVQKMHEASILEVSKAQDEIISIPTSAPVPTSTPAQISSTLDPVAATQTLDSLGFEQVLSALNQITDFSMNYFGAMAIGNYWKKTHAIVVLEHPSLECWVVDHRGKIAYFSESIPSDNLNSEQFGSLQAWVKRFLSECDRIIVDYPRMLSQMGISAQVKQIISF